MNCRIILPDFFILFFLTEDNFFFYESIAFSFNTLFSKQ